MSLPRLLVILGSGETTPTMVKTHREVFARLGPPPVAAFVINTPFGFQENREDLAARAVDYFRESVGQELRVAEFRSAEVARDDPVGYESMLADLVDLVDRDRLHPERERGGTGERDAATRAQL